MHYLRRNMNIISQLIIQRQTTELCYISFIWRLTNVCNLAWYCMIILNTVLFIIAKQNLCWYLQLNTTIVNSWIIVYHVLIRNLLKLTTCYDKLWINVYITVLFCKRKRQNKAFTIFVSLHEFCVYLRIPLSRSF